MLLGACNPMLCPGGRAAASAGATRQLREPPSPQQFLRGEDLAGLRSQTEVLVAPLVTAFVEQEGSWWFTAGTDDEHGQSAWVRYAQTLTFWGDLFSMACSYSCISISLYGDCDPIAPPVALQAAQAQRKMAA